MVDKTLTLVGDVFVTVIVYGDKENQFDVEEIYTSQYLADQAAARFNKNAKENGLRARMGVICRDLYSF